MTPEDRKNFAQQILDNPLFGEVMDKLERTAIEQCIYAQTDEKRAFAAMNVQAIRSFRTDCDAALRSTQTRKAAPA